MYSSLPSAGFLAGPGLHRGVNVGVDQYGVAHTTNLHHHGRLLRARVAADQPGRMLSMGSERLLSGGIPAHPAEHFVEIWGFQQ
eukprot:1616924-Amphidinium_carterae.1